MGNMSGAGQGGIGETIRHPPGLEAPERPGEDKPAGPTILILYYSKYGNNFLMAQAVAQGVTETGGEVRLRTLPDQASPAVLAADERLIKARNDQRDVVVAAIADLANIDGIILGSPPQFGNMCDELRDFLHQAGDLWTQGIWDGKPAGVFCTSSTMHGDQDATLAAMMFTLLHHGALIVGVPYSAPESTAARQGGTPYEPNAAVSPTSDEPPGDTALATARELGRRVTKFARQCRESAIATGLER